MLRHRFMCTHYSLVTMKTESCKNPSGYQTPYNKPTGPDDIYNEHLKYAGNRFIQHIQLNKIVYYK